MCTFSISLLLLFAAPGGWAKSLKAIKSSAIKLQTQKTSASQSLNVSTDDVGKILILGDSLTEGYGVEIAQTFPRLLEKKLNSAVGLRSSVTKPVYSVLAAGIGGATSASAVRRFKWHLKSKPKWLIVALGGNDVLRGLKAQDTQKNLDALIELALSHHIKVILAGMKSPPNYGKEYALQFDQLFLDLSKKWQVPLIPFLLTGVAGEADKNIDDGIHPNAKGHQIIADNLFRALKGLL